MSNSLSSPRIPITEKEISQVRSFLMDGLSQKNIAKKMGISKHRIYRIMKNIRRKEHGANGGCVRFQTGQNPTGYFPPFKRAEFQ
ncbi:hypothetical protein GS501_00155 [Saccharibacter sp. 17.LH.SD]|uniref:helix-turn-helix transcriptional regulator n=1 Tax=Saccharibacter sp. 17.LH.SD TaxID=2689393 RepID=UPI00136AC648|nr:helix-turn-helix domain-containing protein [Saccharibacter sp. 17.LH.SD]MXV43493.1 hypothetical protein [Saccharibacter sp. 17.LH.SD]